MRHLWRFTKEGEMADYYDWNHEKDYGGPGPFGIVGAVFEIIAGLVAFAV